jgi:putative ABC transport system ATP-binding protein
MSVSAHELSHSFPGTGVLFTGLSFELHAGDLVAVTGPSGSGKSTLLSLLAKWEKPVAGSVEWSGIESVGWVFQNPHGTPGRSALDHVVLPLLAKGKTRTAAEVEARAIMARFALLSVADRPFSALSGGEAQRLMLARAVAKTPSLLLVDEPTAQLDRSAAHTVNSVLGELALADAIVVVATHDADTRAACPIEYDLAAYAPEGLVEESTSEPAPESTGESLAEPELPGESA